ncbi:hypothetical protein MRX96_024158 [Rhipicephalus microplus]
MRTPRATDITVASRLLLSLMKMKHGLTFAALGALFSVHRTTSSCVFYAVPDLLHAKTEGWLVWFPREVVQETMPPSFKEKYPMCRVIIDCTEVPMEMPPEVSEQENCLSSYKSNFKLKYIVGVAPSRFISYVSEVFGGRASATYITANCGLLDLLEEDDLVLADKGFPHICYYLEFRKAKARFAMSISSPKSSGSQQAQSASPKNLVSVQEPPSPIKDSTHEKVEQVPPSVEEEYLAKGPGLCRILVIVAGTLSTLAILVLLSVLVFLAPKGNVHTTPPPSLCTTFACIEHAYNLNKGWWRVRRLFRWRVRKLVVSHRQGQFLPPCWRRDNHCCVIGKMFCRVCLRMRLLGRGGSLRMTCRVLGSMTCQGLCTDVCSCIL